MTPCFGGFPPSFLKRKSAFSAPSSWMVEAGYIASFLRLPAWARRRAPMSGPVMVVRLGARVVMCVSI